MLGIPYGNFSINGGLVKYNGYSWYYYHDKNSKLPFSEVSALAIDQQDHIWIGCEKSLIEIDGENWTVFNSQNSGLPDRWINAIAIDSDGAKWIGLHGLQGGLVYYKGMDWILYNNDNSNIPFNHIQNIAIDTTGDVWIGSNKGLAKFNGEHWELFDISNSSLPSNNISTIAIDSWCNKWIGTDAGLAIYRKGGVILTSAERSEFSQRTPSQVELFQNYPNPFNPITTIKYKLNKSGNVLLKIFNLSGQEVDILVNAFQTIGEHEITWQPNSLSSGIYFYKLQAGEFSETKKLILQK